MPTIAATPSKLRPTLMPLSVELKMPHKVEGIFYEISTYKLNCFY